MNTDGPRDELEPRRRARIEPEALEELRACSRSHHLPAGVDPLQSDYRLSILAPETAALAATATQAA